MLQIAAFAPTMLYDDGRNDDRCAALYRFFEDFARERFAGRDCRDRTRVENET